MHPVYPSRVRLKRPGMDLLEAMRGYHSIWLFCIDDRTGSFSELLESVHRYGREALSNLFSTSQHLFPSLRSLDIAWPMKSVAEEFVSLEEAALPLSHRHVTRPGDKIVIWGLLIGKTVSKSALEFSKRHE